jgi:aspartate racemase
MSTIGLLGGMSAESTAQYYRLINENVRHRLGGLHSADCLLYSVDFAPIAMLQAEGRWDEAAELLAAGARRLQAGGAGFFLLCTNTMHKVADAVQASVSIPLLHIGDVTAEAVTAADASRVGLLGTAFTMEQPFLRERLARRGLDVIIPNADDRADAHRIIYDELCRGLIREESRTRYRAIIEHLVEDGAEGVILACTEIELLVGQSDSPVPVFPTTRLHARAAVDRALA